MHENRTVLYADDDADDRELFQSAIMQIMPDANLTMVSDGVELMALLNNDVLFPDIIFLDLNMPCKNGAECLMEIRAEQKFDKIPVVVLSTSYEQGSIDFAFNNGADKYVSKPNSYSVLKTSIGKILSLNWESERENRTAETFVL